MFNQFPGSGLPSSLSSSAFHNSINNSSNPLSITAATSTLLTHPSSSHRPLSAAHFPQPQQQQHNNNPFHNNMNPMTGGMGLSGNPGGGQNQSSLIRPLSPTLAGLSALHGQQQQQQSLQSQASPNSAFLQGFSSRLASRSSAAAASVYQTQTSTSGRGGSLDIFDNMAAGMPIGPSSNSFGFRSGNSAGQNFGIPIGNSQSGAGPPSTFDINEFPTLGGSGNTGGGSHLIGGSAPGSNRPNYGQLVKDHNQSNANEYNNKQPAFDMNYNDFPALPGANVTGGTGSSAGGNANAGSNSMRDHHHHHHVHDGPGGHFSSSGLGLGGNLGSGFHSQSVMMGTNSSSSGGNSGESITGLSAIGSGSRDNQQQPGSKQSVIGSNSTNSTHNKRGIQTTKDGRVTNIPMGMVTDQFGMIGLLSFLRVADSDPNLVSLALGTDLTNLKLDLNSSDTLYSSFPGPWSDQSLRPYEIDYPVPSEYLIHSQIKDKLASLKDKLSRYGEDILFFLFYMFPNDYNQIAASQELFHRDWRYHKDEKIWITRAPGYPPTDKSQTYERGTYIFFDPQNWRKQPKEFLLEYDRLENRVVSVGNHLIPNSGNMPGIAA